MGLKSTIGDSVVREKIRAPMLKERENIRAAKLKRREKTRKLRLKRREKNFILMGWCLLSKIWGAKLGTMIQDNAFIQ